VPRAWKRFAGFDDSPTRSPSWPFPGAGEGRPATTWRSRARARCDPHDEQAVQAPGACHHGGGSLGGGHAQVGLGSTRYLLL